MSAPSRERVGIYPDWIAPPIWLLDDDGREVGNGINLVSGTPLAGRLEDWGLRWDANLDVEGQSKSEAVEAALLDELRELASEIQTQLGPPYLVELRLDA